MTAAPRPAARRCAIVPELRQRGNRCGERGRRERRCRRMRRPRLHRPVATPCPTDRSAPPICNHIAAGASPANGGNCTQDADCKSGQNGRCASSSPNDSLCDVCSYDECLRRRRLFRRWSRATAARAPSTATTCAARQLPRRRGLWTGRLLFALHALAVTTRASRPRRRAPSVARRRTPASRTTIARRRTSVGSAATTAPHGLWPCFDYPGCPT